jgi:hypothetical protein
MAYVSSSRSRLRAGFGRPIVQALFLASCLLSIVSFYTTQQGMSLYLTTWFSVLASLGIQISLVMVAWLIGFTRKSRGLLIAVYAITAIVSIAFSYVSLYTWFNARERPALLERALYDELIATAARTDQLLSQAIANGNRYVLALEEMTAAEKNIGHISRARDADPYLDRIRESVAREASTYGDNYPEGAGPGVRYTAFDRYTKLTRQTVSDLGNSRAAVKQFRTGLKPDTPTEAQLRQFHTTFDPIPWASVEQLLPGMKLERPLGPAYSRYVERSSSGQEDLIRAFDELISAPTGRHVFSLLLAAFIDLIVFLVAYAAGPYFYGNPEERWVAGGANLDSTDQQVFVRDLLAKLRPGRQGLPRVPVSDLTPGEHQVCLLLSAKGLVTTVEEEGALFYLFASDIHERLLESLAEQTLPLRAATRGAAA